MKKSTVLFPVLDMNRRASDSGAHLLLFQQLYGVTGSNTLGAIRPTHVQSPSSNVRQIYIT